jgi:hypothetical protein
MKLLVLRIVNGSRLSENRSGCLASASFVNKGIANSEQYAQTNIP